MSNSSEPVIYQLKILLLTITPTIWRRVLVSSDHTIEDLHYTVQLAMGWENAHLHHFLIHGKYYGIRQPRCTTFSDRAEEVKLGSFGFREKEKFLYEYHFSRSAAMGTWRYWWRHQIRVEAILKPVKNKTYPVCTAGKGICPPEDCGGRWEFMKRREEFFISDVLEVVTQIVENKKCDIDFEAARELLTWLSVYQNRFDRQKVNQRLLQYFTGDRESLFFE